MSICGKKTSIPCGRASDQIEIFSIYLPEIPIHSRFLYYAGSPKVPPRVFGPLSRAKNSGAKNPAGAIIVFVIFTS